jgi:hypothetical protein
MIYVLLEKHQFKAAGRENLVSQVAGAMEGRGYYSTQEKLALFLLGRSFAHRGGRGMGRPSWCRQASPRRWPASGTQFQSLSAANSRPE